MKLPELDIVLPCYNPGTDWAQHIIESFHELQNKLPETKLNITLVNDGSSKGIIPEDIIRLKNEIGNFNYINYSENRGKGFALRKGIENTTADLCIYTDVDFPYTTECIIKILNELTSSQCDIVAGVKDKNYYKHVPAFRRFISKLLRSCTGFVLRLKVNDTQCGLKGFNKAGKTIFLSTTIDRYLFDLEFIFLASRNNTIKIKPVEIELKENIQFSSMRAGILFTEAGNFLKIFFKSL